ncbi:hypothetical protein T484DRAFT_1757725, partial [Baffinella frigidus]
MFTLPVGDNNTGAPTTLSAMEAWDPTQTEPDGHFTALESWVQKLVAHAKEVSPLYWSHRIKHVASDSRVCTDFLFAGDPAADVAPSWSNNISLFDAHATLAAAVQPGPSRGIYSSWVQKLTFDVPAGVDQEQAIFRQTNSSMWALGQVMRSCFCGWDSVQDAQGRVWCKIPRNLCIRTVAWSQRVRDICELQSGMYWNHFEKSEDSRTVGPEMQAHIQSFDRLDCPWNMADADTWGLLDEESFVSHWLLERPNETATRFTSKHLLFEGRGGVRSMNAEDVLKRGRDSPLTLFNPLEVASTVAQHHCEAHVNARHSTATGVSYADHFRDVLFPAVQGVPENRVTSFCLRYVVEMATFTAMRHVLSVDSFEITQQLQVMSKWKRKCHTQTKLLGFCALRNVFASHRVKSNPNNDGVLTNHVACTGIKFKGTMVAGDSFVVAGASCVAVYHKTSAPHASHPLVLIFDPCRVVNHCHQDNLGEAPVEIIISEFLAMYSTSVAVLDASSFLSTHSRALSMKWSKSSDKHWEPIQAKRDHFALNNEQDGINSDAVGLNIENLWKKYVQPQASPLGNSPWHQKTGRRMDDPDASCGGVSDWWPEKWEHPVGFHVTTPCARTAAYRTFNNHFEYDQLAHKMRYRHGHDSGVRNETLLMNNAGAAGMCRLNTFAQRLREQNNVRVCTRMRTNVRVDYAVPLLSQGRTPRSEYTWTDAACSSSPLHVPWNPDTTTHARLRSSGMLASWPDDIDTVWPKSGSKMLDLGLSADSAPHSWTEGGGGCGMPPLYECTQDIDCSDAAIGVKSDTVMRCVSNVCMVVGVSANVASVAASWIDASNAVQCTAHSHCAAPPINRPDHLCSGEGRCVLPVLEVLNEFEGGSVDLSWYAKSCDSAVMDKVDMYGKSSWGRITGLLEAHGLCSYRNWYEYRRVFEQQCSPSGQTAQDKLDNICKLPSDTHWIDTSREENDIGFNIFASQKVLYQEPHSCDRNFQHYTGHVMCSPRINPSTSSALMMSGRRNSLFRRSVSATYSNLYHTYYRDNIGSVADDNAPQHVKIARMEYMENVQTGFLGTGHDWNSLHLKPCVELPQCSQPNYNIQGHVISERLVVRGLRLSGATSMYRVADAVRCGAFGVTYINGQTVKCLVDFAVAPLAYLVVYHQNVLKEHCKVNAFAQNWEIPLKLEYTPNESGRKIIQDILRKVINGYFKTGFNTVAEYNE